MTGGAPAGDERVVVEQRVAASRETVFAFFSSTEAWLRWQGMEGEIDARPGGVFRMNLRGDRIVSGQFVEVDPSRRCSRGAGRGRTRRIRPPGASVVEVDLLADGAHTRVRVKHRIRGVEMGPLVQQGWTIYLERLAGVAAAGQG